MDIDIMGMYFDDNCKLECKYVIFFIYCVYKFFNIVDMNNMIDKCLYKENCIFLLVILNF